ncbi:hypothetical protein J2R76_003963 [Bradyrhizobium sp. USDA 4532]|nr:hypothetical protein [Bradyrhizobium sp. USDA 4545]MCP1920372.1 hypothetical protein [Bradyrhizobium sp. USDA 4532]
MTGIDIPASAGARGLVEITIARGVNPARSRTVATSFGITSVASPSLLKYRTTLKTEETQLSTMTIKMHQMFQLGMRRRFTAL